MTGEFVSGTIARHFYNKRNKFWGLGFQATYAKGSLNENRIDPYDKEISGGSFTYPVNQENFVDQWAYLGYTTGKGGKPSCYVSVGNYNSAATGTQEFWMDAMKYYPSSSTTPPVYKHSFSQWIP